MPAKMITLNARSRCALALATACAILAGCTPRSVVRDVDARRWADARQLVLVTIADWDAQQGTLRGYERSRRAWREVLPAQRVMIGRAGAAWGLGLHPAQPDGPTKREGDGRSPAGVFGIGDAFGYATDAATALHYRALQDTDYCVDTSGSPLYNRIVDAAEVGAAAVAQSTEPMRRDLHANGDQRYRLGFVIDHNPQAQAEAGSCIFAHLWKSSGDATAGCTAMDASAMQPLLAWLRADHRPIFALLPATEYRRLRRDWNLPAMDTTP